ncbi:conserved protein of unknown function [Burkholderia multivorans]
MANVKELIARRLAVLVGLDVSAINHAADLLTIQFGPLRHATTRRGTVKQVGAWALHVQCNWQIERAGDIVATQDDLCGPDDKAHRAAERLDELFVKQGPTTVESVRGSESGGVWIALSAGMRIVITPNGVVDEEDWRFFAPGVDAAHFVIEGGRPDPDSLN